MPDNLPHFRYHPHPVETGAIEVSSLSCRCCERPRGFIYVGPVYGYEDLHDSLCPWCIADGTAAEKLGASFADEYPLVKAKLPQEVVQEVHLRTPAFSSWQQEQWLAHCADACAYLGAATVEDLIRASEATKHHMMDAYLMSEDHWQTLTDDYEPGGDPAVYKFQCLHCGMVLLNWDAS